MGDTEYRKETELAPMPVSIGLHSTGFHKASQGQVSDVPQAPQSLGDFPCHKGVTQLWVERAA